MTLLAAVAAAALAQVAGTPITLAQARQLSRSNTQVLISEMGRRQAEAGVTAARAPLLPQVTLSAEALAQVNGERASVQNVPQVASTGETQWISTAVDVEPVACTAYGFSAQLSQILYDPGHWAALTQAGAQHEAARAQEAEDQNASELEAIRRFYELLRTQRTRQLLQERVTSSEQLLECARALFSAGRIKKEEEIAAAVNLGTDQMVLLRQDASVAAAQASLAVWLGRPATEALVAQDPGTLSGEARLELAHDRALELARARRPQLQAYAALVRAARSAVDSASAGYLPVLSAYAGYARAGDGVSPYFTDPTKQNTVQAGVVVSWKAFSGFGTEAKVAQARTELRRAELVYAQAEQDVAAELRRGLEDLSSLVRVATLTKATLDLTRNGLVLATSRYEVGDSSTLQVRDAQVKLTQAEVGLLESHVNVEIARAVLERTMGTLGDSP